MMFKSLFRSGCLVRTLHVLLTWGTAMILFLYDTDIRKQEQKDELAQPVVFVALILLSVVLYFTVSLMNPGFILSDSEALFTPSVDEDELEKMTPPDSNCPRQRRCGHCLLLQPMRAKHCKVCRHCVRRFDHHCPWIDNCVGERNHRWFLVYLWVQLLVVVWGFDIACSGIHFAPTWREWFMQNCFLLGAAGVTGVFIVVVIMLLCSQLYLAAFNTTTWEFMSRHTISYLKHCDSEENPFDRGILCNLWGFFCVCRSVAWERVYAKWNRSDDPQHREGNRESLLS